MNQKYVHTNMINFLFKLMRPAPAAPEVKDKNKKQQNRKALSNAFTGSLSDISF